MSGMPQHVPNVPPDVNVTNVTFSMSQMSHFAQMSKMSVNGTVLRVLYGNALPLMHAPTLREEGTLNA